MQVYIEDAVWKVLRQRPNNPIAAYRSWREGLCARKYLPEHLGGEARCSVWWVCGKTEPTFPMRRLICGD